MAAQAASPVTGSLEHLVVAKLSPLTFVFFAGAWSISPPYTHSANFLQILRIQPITPLTIPLMDFNFSSQSEFHSALNRPESHADAEWCPTIRLGSWRKWVCFTVLCIAILTFSFRQNVAHGCFANLLLFTAYMGSGWIMRPTDICGPCSIWRLKSQNLVTECCSVTTDSIIWSSPAFLTPAHAADKIYRVFTAALRGRNCGF